MTYEQRLRQIAEEFAKLSYTHFHLASHEVQLHWILSMLPLAEIAIRREGEAYKVGYMDCELGRPKNSIHDLGLIKPTTDGTD